MYDRRNDRRKNDQDRRFKDIEHQDDEVGDDYEWIKGKSFVMISRYII